MDLSVVIPCYNEAACIERFETELYGPLDTLGLSYEVIAVDDGSVDGTPPALAALAAKRPLKILAHPRNRGLGAALRTGIAQARGEWIATLDADLTFSPASIADLLACQKRTGADLVAGSPYATDEGMAQVPWRRRLPSLLINALYRGLFDRTFSSYTPMFRLYRRSALLGLPLTSDGFELSAELAARFIKSGRCVAETPVTLTTRRQGVSKLRRWRELKNHAVLIARLLNIQ